MAGFGRRQLKLASFLGVAFAILLLAAACSSGSSASTPTAAASASATTAATATSAPTASPTASSGAAAATVKVGDSKLGKVLTDGAGMTLYTFKPDASSPGTSNCTGGCANIWPPLTATTAPAVSGATGSFTLITRSGGTLQVAYKSMPLYTYSRDKAPGDTNGEGVGNAWYVATP